ncbi:hypothetical protein FNV43_RR24300 [Rhamnella rubrinervis]|uniref:Uncharacterized protein n=1 Tax=Rhamnella rubrinervis TaxID=2594499 RepID=A0A8K0GQL1_9ROSA|nr:hypothetical protein FNV43_RR24300 [Rhamnella rubrinervis]
MRWIPVEDRNCTMGACVKPHDRDRTVIMYVHKDLSGDLSGGGGGLAINLPIVEKGMRWIPVEDCGPIMEAQGDLHEDLSDNEGGLAMNLSVAQKALIR